MRAKSWMLLGLITLPLACQGLSTGDPSTTVDLTRRLDNGPYGQSAYSFRYSTGDVDVHKGSVDLVYERCGLLHVSLHGGQENRILDVGSKPPEDGAVLPSSGWRERSIKPIAGHYYIQEVAFGDHATVVRFQVMEFTPDHVRLRWMPIDGDSCPWPLDLNAGAGRKGQCGGPHSES